MKDMIDEVKGLLEEFKKTNDARLEEIEKKGAADPLTVEKQQKLEARIDEIDALRSKLEKLEVLATRPQGGSKEAHTPEQLRHVEAFEAWLRDPNDNQKASELGRAGLEAKAVSSATSSGGHAIPEVIGSRIQATLELNSPMRNVVDVITVGSSDYKEIVDINGQSGGWVGETGTRNATGTPSLQQVSPTMGEVYAKPEIYEHIMDDAFFDIGGWLVRKVTEEIARLEGIAFISGDGSNKPTGFLNGVPVVTGDFDSPARAFQALQYLPTGAAGAFQADSMASPPGEPFGVFHDTIAAMRPGWRGGSVWLMNTTTKGVLRRMRDADGRYLMGNGSIEGGETNEILGYRVEEMDHMPDIGANTFPVAFGNFREGYLAVERTSLRITIDDNITTPGTVKFYVRKRVGGIVRQDQAIKVIKAAAS